MSTAVLISVVGCKPDPKPGDEFGPGPVQREAVQTCERTVVAEVAVLSQLISFNRLGTTQTGTMIFALARDLEVKTGTAPWQWLIDTAEWQTYAKCRESGDPCVEELDAVAKAHSAVTDLSNVANNRYVRMREDHRPRPLVLRANVGDCLEVNLANLLPEDPESTAGVVTTNFVGFHPVGMELVSSIDNDGQIVGKNPNAVAAAVQTSTTPPVPASAARQYRYLATHESVHFVSSSTDNNDAQLNAGLFGAVHVQPRGAEYYRSQVTEADLSEASLAGAELLTINYQATFDGSDPSKPWKGKGVPILAMLQDRGNNRQELMYGDLTAIITGPNAGVFTGDSPVFTENPASPNRRQPYREFTIIYHEPGSVAQAFPQIFDNPTLQATAEAGKDLFGINYGTGGIGAEILANRLGVGPMADCADCRYEEFFLSAWTVGDPAMNVDYTATQIYDKIPGIGDKARVAYFPDDPSNVYHSYLGDHVKMRVHHGGAIHHLHHLHAHQWLHSPNSNEGHYLDSQLIGPGSSFTMEIAYNGSGNRNQTVGDSIFHCHFYPHFAEGMWGMWRVHDVYEAGTELEEVELDYFGAKQKFMVPAKGSRALPDGEIALGTPIPGVVPVPTLPIAPQPSKVYIADGQVHYGEPPTDGSAGDRWGDKVTQNPGFPFFIPGQAGSRAPHPPRDFATQNGEPLDGGLPRHLVMGGDKIVHYENKFDWSRFTNEIDAVELDENGTNVEQVAMAAHATRNHPTNTPEGKLAQFVYNGMPPQPGAPFADPCYDVDQKCLIEHNGDYNACPPQPVANASTPRNYRAADIQHDVVLNKDGWHYPQQRLAVLWNDIQPTLDNQRPPQPFFFRSNSGECIEFWLTNLVPNYYELDNFQVRTPTDILGQHIHLVKFDVTSSDGAANGFNYEDGTFSYEEVVERIEAINDGGGLAPLGNSEVREMLEAEVPQYLCDAGVSDCKEFAGAQTTVQRWWADPLLNKLENGKDRTIRTVFTHDHFGPSTHQQAGLYSGLLVEPAQSKWWDAEHAGVELGGGKNPDGSTRSDGGPTSWQAVITNADQSDGFREFALEFQDAALAYEAGGAHQATPYPSKNMTATPEQVTAQNNALNQLTADQGGDIRKLVGGFIFNPDDYRTSKPTTSAKPIAAPPTPQLISAPFQGLWGTYSVNYRHEPLAFRATNDDPATKDQFEQCPPGEQDCDNAYLYASIERPNRPAFNSQHVGEEGFPPALTSGVYGWDPFTPMLRAYEGETVQIRTLVGAHVQMHNFMTHGFAWLFEPANTRSGFRDSQSMGISEHFEMEFQIPASTRVTPPAAAGQPTNVCGQEPPATQAFTDYLYTPSSSIAGQLNGNWGLIRAYKQGTAQCLTEVPKTPLVAGPWACPADAPKRELKVAAYNASLIYNSRDNISNPNALVYTGCDATLDPGCTPPNPGSNPIAGFNPLVLRVAAGECVQVTLQNNFDPTSITFTGEPGTALAAPGTFFDQSLTFGQVKADPSYYAGLHPQMLAYDGGQSSGLNVGFNSTAQTAAPGASIEYTWYAGMIAPDGTGTPVEFGVVNLLSADPLLQSGFGLVGALVVEPAGATWTKDVATQTLAQISVGKDSFTDVVLITLDGVAAQISESSGTTAANVVLANYGTEPVQERFESRSAANMACQYSNLLVATPTQPGEPQTPIFAVESGAPVRFRVVHPWGNDQQVFELFGHLWQEEPFADGSTVIAANSTSEWQGFRAGWGSTDRLNVIIDDAGGPYGVKGDYLYRLRDVNLQATNGVWGLLRVGDESPPLPVGFCIGTAPSGFLDTIPEGFELPENLGTAVRQVPGFVPALPAG